MKKSMMLSVGLAVACLGAPPALAAPQPVITGPYPLLTQTLYDVDYAVSTGGTLKQPSAGSETVISIGLPDVAPQSGALCQAQVDWFDWSGAAAGLSGPGFLPNNGGPNNLVPGRTLEFTSSLNSPNPFEYPPFDENVFRNITNPKGSLGPFEGRAEIRVTCPVGAPSLTALRVDAEVVSVETTSTGQLTFTYKPINVTRVIGLNGY